MSLFDKKLNDEWKAGGISAATTLAHYLGVDIRIEQVQNFLPLYWHEQLVSGKNQRCRAKHYCYESKNMMIENVLTYVLLKSERF